jgi:hypothetical protein
LNFFSRATRFGVRRLDAAFEVPPMAFHIVNGVVICGSQ